MIGKDVYLRHENWLASWPNERKEKEAFYLCYRCFCIVGFYLSLARFVPRLILMFVEWTRRFRSIFFSLFIFNPFSVAKMMRILLNTFGSFFWDEVSCFFLYIQNVSNHVELTFKVAEHSFSAHFCWCKLARVQGFQKTNMPSTERSFYLLNTRTICVIFLYNCMQCIDGSSILLQRYVTKGNDAKNLAHLAFVCYWKNPVKCNACAVARKIETDCFSRSVPFSSDPGVRISRNLAKRDQRPLEWSITKNLNFDIGNS